MHVLSSLSTSQVATIVLHPRNLSGRCRHAWPQPVKALGIALASVNLVQPVCAWWQHASCTPYWQHSIPCCPEPHHAQCRCAA